jgi:hypothetical protein
MRRLTYGRMAQPLRAALYRSYAIDLPIDYLPDKSVICRVASVEGKTVPVVFCGWRFSAAEIELICEVVSDFQSLSLTEIARTICELLEWKRPNGRLKNHECRLFLEKLSAEGVLNLISLPTAVSVISVSPWCNGFRRFYHHGGTENAEGCKKNLKSGH